MRLQCAGAVTGRSPTQTVGDSTSRLGTAPPSVPGSRPYEGNIKGLYRASHSPFSSDQSQPTSPSTSTLQSTSVAMNGTTGLPLNPSTDSPYNYIPTEWITILFVVLFSATTILHAIEGLYFKIWWMLPTLCACGLTEIIGWAGRTWSSRNPWIMNPFLMQIVCTIIAPTFMTAGMFFIFGRVIGMVGPEYSRMTPKVYSIVFISFDFIALVIQAIGGAKAASADNEIDANNGAHIMVAGILIQMAAITLYVCVQTEYLVRVWYEKPLRPRISRSASLDDADTVVGHNAAEEYKEKDQSAFFTSAPAGTGLSKVTRNIALMLLGLFFATFLIYIRSIYRTVELFDGWSGPIISNEKLFNGLDGTPIFLAMLTLNVFHPGLLIPLGIRKEASSV